MSDHHGNEYGGPEYEPPRDSVRRGRMSGTEILVAIVAVVVGLVILGAVLQVVRAVLWSLAVIIIVFLAIVGWREYQRSGSWGSAFRMSGRTFQAMVRRVSAVFGRGLRRD